MYEPVPGTRQSLRKNGENAMRKLEIAKRTEFAPDHQTFPDAEVKTVFFTICSWNYLAYALTLWSSLIKTNGPVSFYAAICDPDDRFDSLSLPFPVIPLDELGIPSLDSMKQRYSITELNTAIKPFVFTYLFEEHPESLVVYMDPDILVTSRLKELKDLFLQGADCVLTPHILEPNEFAVFKDRKMLTYGIHNLGFCALRDTPRVRRVVSWWGRMLEEYCVIDLPNGLFVDQKWADLLPAFIERTRILHHSGYNVAYWNLPQRTVGKTEDGWSVNNLPLRFFHFSGNEIKESSLFSRHSRDFLLPLGDTQLLFSEYVKQVRANGHDYYRRIPYSFSWNGAAGTNPHTPQSEQSECLSSESRPLGPSETVQLIQPIPLLRVSSRSDFEKMTASMKETFRKRREHEIESIPSDEPVFYLPGYCVVCGEDSEFQVRYTQSADTIVDGRRIPDWREHLSCIRCGFVSKVRAFLHVFFQEHSPSKDDCIYITEQSTPTYTWLASRFSNLIGSKFDQIESEVTMRDLRHRAVPDESLDYVLSLDVLQHASDYRRMLREVCRCLKKGGWFLFTVPFSLDQDESIVATVESSGELGSSRYRFGWGLVEDLSAEGFETAEILSFWSRQYCYLGESQTILAARKPSEVQPDR